MNILTPSNMVISGTFANRPVSPLAGTMYYATDLGTGIVLVWNGSNWKPISGYAELANGQGTAITGTIASTVLGSFKIPGGLLSPNGSIKIFARWKFVATVSGFEAISIASTVTAAGTQIQESGVAIGATYGSVMGGFRNANSLSNQNCNSGNNSGLVVGGGAITLGTVNTASDFFVSFFVILGAIADTYTLVDYSAEWIEP